MLHNSLAFLAFRVFNVSLPAICVLPFATTQQELSVPTQQVHNSVDHIRGFMYQRLVYFVETARPGVCLNCFICQQECY